MEYGSRAWAKRRAKRRAFRMAWRKQTLKNLVRIAKARAIVQSLFPKRKKIRPYFRRDDLHEPHESGAAKILRGRRDAAYMAYLRVPVEGWDTLLALYSPVWAKTPMAKNKKARPGMRKLSAELSLTLVLRFINGGVLGADQCVAVGIDMAGRSRHLYHGLVCFVKTLEENPKYSFGLPPLAVRELWARVAWKISGDVVKDVAFLTDGVVVSCECMADSNEENINYSGYKKMVARKVLPLFELDGKISLGEIGKGSHSDSKLHSSIEVQLRQQHLEDRKHGSTRIFQAAADSAFRDCEVICKEANLPVQHKNKIGLFRTIRNCAEIGIGSMTKSMRVLNFRLPGDDEEMVVLVIKASMLFMNYRIRECGVGQLTTMIHELREEAAIELLLAGRTLYGRSL